MSGERARIADVTPDDDANPSHETGAGTLYPDMFELRDRDALALLRKREEHGFDLAYERYAERIFGFLVRLSRSRAVAEDLLQHTFLRLAENGPRLRPDSDLRAWLFTVARNAYQSHARGLGVEARLDPAFAWPPLASAAGPESGLVLQELERALARLQPEDRELLLLIGVEGLSYAEMGVVLAIDVVTARKRVSRARARLAQILDEQPGVVRNSELKP
jgi:RNA polymerase sigma-70 factor, ECF subfamily